MLPKPEGREPIRTNGTRSETARETKVQVFKGTRKSVPVGLKEILTPKILDIKVVPRWKLKGLVPSTLWRSNTPNEICWGFGKASWIFDSSFTVRFLPGKLGSNFGEWNFDQIVVICCVSFESCHLCKQEAPLVTLVVACVACDLAEYQCPESEEDSCSVIRNSLDTETKTRMQVQRLACWGLGPGSWTKCLRIIWSTDAGYNYVGRLFQFGFLTELWHQVDERSYHARKVRRRGTGF